MKPNKRIAVALLSALLGVGLALPAFGQDSTSSPSPLAERLSKVSVPSTGIGKDFHFDADAPAISEMPRGGGSFGGGGRSFGGGGGSRSFGGGGFGGGGTSQPRSGGSFGGGSRSFGGSTSSPRTSPGGSSFGGRTGAMGSGGATRGTNITGPGPRGSSSFYYNGHSYYGYGYGGYSYGWMHPAWYMYTPFYPTFYYSQPYIGADGFYHPGGFSFMNAIGGLCCCPLIFIGIIWAFSKGMRGKRVKYTTYQ